MKQLVFDYVGKICTRCGKWKLLDQFSRQFTGRLGRTSQCKECKKIDLRKWRAKARIIPEHEQLYVQGLQRCTKCKQVLPLAAFSKNKNGRYGYNFHCRKCKHQYYRKCNPLDSQIVERKILGVQGLKRCTECNQIKPFVAFRKESKGAYGYASKCKQCKVTHDRNYRREYYDEILARQQQWHDENRDKINARGRERYASNRKKERIRSHRYYAANREKERTRSRKYRIENPEKRRVSNRKWETKNPDKVLAKHVRRRTRKTNAGGSFTADEWQILCEKYDNCCLCCSEAKPLEPDHIVPVSKGGHSNITNIQPLCRSCNASKGTEIIDYR